MTWDFACWFATANGCSQGRRWDGVTKRQLIRLFSPSINVEGGLQKRHCITLVSHVHPIVLASTKMPCLGWPPTGSSSAGLSRLAQSSLCLFTFPSEAFRILPRDVQLICTHTQSCSQTHQDIARPPPLVSSSQLRRPLNGRETAPLSPTLDVPIDFISFVFALPSRALYNGTTDLPLLSFAHVHQFMSREDISAISHVQRHSSCYIVPTS